MRTNLLLFLAFGFGPFLLAQDYVPVIINGEVFFKTELLTSAGSIPAEITVTNFKKIDGQLYNRVFFKRGLEGDMLVGYFREDPGQGQIYYRPINGTTESLVYDISLEVGDMVELDARWCDDQNNDQAQVVAVNDIEGLRELVFDRQVGEGELCQTLTFLESVGPSASLLFPYFRDAILQNGVAMRICHASHQAIVYYPADAETDLCGFSTVDTRNLAPEQLTLFPNPVQQLLHISDTQAGDQITIYTATGQLIASQAAMPTLDTSSWSAGMYFLRLSRTDGQIAIARVVKT